LTSSSLPRAPRPRQAITQPTAPAAAVAITNAHTQTQTDTHTHTHRHTQTDTHTHTHTLHACRSRQARLIRIMPTLVYAETQSLKTFFLYVTEKSMSASVLAGAKKNSKYIYIYI